MNSPAMALVAAGLGIMGGTSKFPLVNIGQGGLAGVKYLQDLPKMQQQTFQNDMLKAQYNYLKNAPNPIPGESPLGALAARGQYLLGSPVPGQAQQGAAILKQVHDIAAQGFTIGPDGKPQPIPGIAEYQAYAKGLVSQAEASGKLPAEATLQRFKTQNEIEAERAKPRTIEPGATLMPNGVAGAAPQADTSSSPWGAAIKTIPDARLQNEAVQAANNAGMPDQAVPYWISAIHNESGWNPGVKTGAAGEIGLGQIKPGTGAMLGYTPQQLADPQTNLEASAKYFTRQWQAAKGDPAAALRGYNGGNPGVTAAQPYADAALARVRSWTQQAAPQRSADAGNVSTDATSAPVWTPPKPPEGLPQITAPLPDLSATTPPVPQARRIQNPDGSITMAKNQAFEGAQQATTKSMEKIPEQQDALIAARGQLAGVLDSVRRNADAPTFLQSGWAGETRQDAAKAVNQILSPLGIKAFSDNDIANNEALAKDSTRLAFELARSMGSRAPLGELMQANRGVPNIEVTRFGNLTVGNMLMAANNREYDRNAYIYDQSKKGGDPVEARQTFDRINPPERYISTAFGQAVAQAFPASVTALKSAPTPVNIAAFDRRYGGGAAESLLGR